MTTVAQQMAIDADIILQQRDEIARLKTALAASEEARKGLVAALEFVAESHDAGRHDGLPEPCPANDAVSMWAVAREALERWGIK